MENSSLANNSPTNNDKAETVPAKKAQKSDVEVKPVVKKEIEEIKSREILKDILPSETDGHMLDTEYDGDLFWLIQRILWLIIKITVCVAIIGGIIWLIWGEHSGDKIILQGTTEERTINLPTKKPNEKPSDEINNTPATIIKTIPVDFTNEAKYIVPAETDQIFDFPILLSALNWKKDTEQLFSTPFLKQIEGNNEISRKIKIQKLLNKINSLQNRAYPITRGLSEIVTTATVESRNAEKTSEELSQAFVLSIQENVDKDLENLLTQKIHQEKIRISSDIQKAAHTLLLEKIVSYSKVLENVAINIVSNRTALEKNIKVTAFPADPFERIIHPSEITAP